MPGVRKENILQQTMMRTTKLVACVATEYTETQNYSLISFCVSLAKFMRIIAVNMILIHPLNNSILPFYEE